MEVSRDISRLDVPQVSERPLPLGCPYTLTKKSGFRTAKTGVLSRNEQPPQQRVGGVLVSVWLSSHICRRISALNRISPPKCMCVGNEQSSSASLQTFIGQFTPLTRRFHREPIGG